MVLHDMKELYKSNEYILVKYNDSGYELKWIIQKDFYIGLNGLIFKLIHKKHKDILDAYLDDDQINIEYKSDDWVLCDDDWIETYNENLEYRLEKKGKEMGKKVIDLNNTWCEASKENYDALKKFKNNSDTIFYNWEKLRHSNSFKNNDCFVVENVISEGVNFYWEDIEEVNENSRQIHLVNGEFEYVENFKKEHEEANEIFGEETCYFKKYGFEVPEFECELHFIDACNDVFGLIEKNIAVMWNRKGTCIELMDDYNEKKPEYNLTPYKKPLEWYEDESNFPKHIVDSLNNIVIVSNFDGKCFTIWNGFRMDFKLYKRLATKEEVLQLVIN